MKKQLILIFLLIFSLGYSQPGAGPTAPIARNAWDVFSVFSDVYTPVAGTRNYNPGWGQAGSASVVAAGTDNVWRATNLNYQGLDFGGNINVSAMTTFHVDVYTTNETSLQFFQINNGGGERSYTLTPLNQNSWNSYDIPLTAWTSQSGFLVNNLFQFKIVGSGGKTVYLDNMYFYRAATTQPPTLGTFTVPSKLTTDLPFTLTAPTSNSAGLFSYSSSNTNVATISGNTITIVGAGSSTITATQAANGSYGIGSTTTTFLVTPSGAPTQPVRNTWDVISLFSGAYSDLAGTNFNPNWGQSGFGSFSTPSYNGDPVKQYANLNYQGTETLTDVNASAINTLHLDLFSTTLTSIRLSVIKITGGSVEKPITLTLVPGSWNSFNIDLTSATFSGLDLTKIRQFKYDEPKINGVITNGQTLAVDNIYFWRTATFLPPTVGTFTVASQSVGAPDFTLSPPTSNNTSPFTYTSSNTSVATIVGGNQVHIVGAGSSTITALQVSDGTYGPSSTPATLVVSYPAPGPSPIPPVRDPSTVISMYTGNPAVYANPVGFNMIRAPWTGGTTSDLNFSNGTNTCIKLDNFGFFGFVTSTEPVRFSVAGMAKLHVDIYLNAPLSNLFVFLLSNGDQIYNTGPLVAGWNSLDINLSNYPGADLSSIYGFKFEQNVGPAVQMYLDNIYFFNGGTDPTITDFTVPSKVFGDTDFAITAPTSDSAGAFSYTSSNTSVATIVGGNQIHIVGIGTSTISANQAANGIYDAGSITAPFVVTAPPLTTAAPTPPARNAWDVVSLYSNAYTNLPSATWQGASTLSDELLQGNDTKLMSNFLLDFINFAATDVSQMTMLHMDIYTTDCTGFNIWLLNNGDRNAQFFPTLNGWYSVDIPLSTYSNNGLIMTGISQLKFESLNGPGKTVYVDNVYFYRPATLPPATVGTFTVPAKNVGDANFALTPPTSNNSSPFTYTSSNTAVATIVGGNQIHIVSGGTSTITASQVSDGIYGPSSKTASFVVSFPAPGPSPIPPARAASRVMSMYTGTPSVYANNPLYTTVRAFWTAGATMTQIPNGTNTALKVDNLGYIGLIDQSERRLDVTNMTNLHLDVYVNEPFANLFFWLLTDGDQRRDITNLVPGWNSINIDLTEFAGANLANVYGLKFEQNQPGALQIYLDNIYFSNDTYYTDNDGDGYGDLASPVVGQPVGSVLDATDCDDTRANVHPGAVDVCYDGLDNDCNGNIDNVGMPGGCAPIVTSLVSTTCNTTLASIDSSILANIVANAQGYRWRVTKVISGTPSTNPADVQYLDTLLRALKLTQLTTFAYNTTYKIEVSVRINNVWQPYYGSACTVTTPIPTTKISSSQCGATVALMTDVVYADIVPYTSGYRFKVTNLLNQSDVQIIDRPLREFRFSLLSNVQFSTPYKVEVAAKNNVDGTYFPYGTQCTVTTPSFPVSYLQNSQCDYTATNSNEVVYAALVSNATAYRFYVTNTSLGYSYTFDSNLRSFTLNSVPGLLGSTTYTIQVAVKIGSTFGPYGKSCTLTTPAALNAKTVIDAPSLVQNTMIFEAMAVPNPFAETFKVDVKTSSEESLQIKVYDMLGQLIESKIINNSDVQTLEVGENFPSGVYNVIVSQGENTKTLRVIKR